MDIKLYYAPITCAMVSYVALTQAEAEFETIPLNFRKSEHMSKDYLSINPKHKVPLLTVDGQKISENLAIISWIDSQFPAANLLPADPWDRAQALSIHGWCSGGIHPYLRQINNPAKVVDMSEAAEGIVSNSAAAIYESFEIADDMLAGRRWFFDRFIPADMHFFWCFRRAQQFKLDIERFSNCQAHFERVTLEPSVQKLLNFEQSVQERFDQDN
ncbi:MAG: glutathione S-transferase family protein [Rhodospirillaceae bacterium]